MKKIIVVTLLLVISATSFSQPATKPVPPVKTDYLKKSKSQKTIAWLLLGGGTAVLAVTLIAEASSVCFGTGCTDHPFPYVVVGLGGAAIVGSIPFFIASSRNKKKSMSLSFKNEMAPQIQKSSFVYKSLPSLTLRISL